MVKINTAIKGRKGGGIVLYGGTKSIIIMGYINLFPLFYVLCVKEELNLENLSRICIYKSVTDRQAQ